MPQPWQQPHRLLPGAEQTERVKKGAVIGTGISVCAVGAVSLFLFFCSGWVDPWFIDKKDAELLIPLVVKYMQMMAPFYLFLRLRKHYPVQAAV